METHGNDVIPDDATVPAAEKKPAEETATIGGDGSEITLNEIRVEDAQSIEGELGCGFKTPAGATILVAKSNVADDARPRAAINHNGYSEILVSTSEGGFNRLEREPGEFGGKGLTITIELGDESLTAANTEQTSKFASMDVQRGDGASRVYDGEWICGP